jgi:Arc/MetJ-type ribon-helix-helix transcriptional regulator
MAVVISLREVVEASELHTDESTSYLDPDTGKIVFVTDEMRKMVEEGTFDNIPEWMRKALPEVREALESGRFLPLPSKFDVHEWAVMDRFSRAQANDRVREELLDAIHGAGAFRMFRSTIRRLGIEEAWYQFRDRGLEEIAREWLEEHNLPYR